MRVAKNSSYKIQNDPLPFLPPPQLLSLSKSILWIYIDHYKYLLPSKNEYAFKLTIIISSNKQLRTEARHSNNI